MRHTWRHHLHLGANANGDGDNDGDDIDDDSEDDDDDGTDNDDKDDLTEVFHPCPPQSGLATPPGQDKRRLKREREQSRSNLP